MTKALILLLFIAASVSGLATDPAIPQPDVSFFTKLRMDYAQQKDSRPDWGLNEDRNAIMVANLAKDYEKVFELSERWLAKVPIDAEIHKVRSNAAAALGDIKSYMHHRSFAYNLMQSLIQSGDGLTPNTAFKIVSLQEQYSVLEDFGARIRGQSTTDEIDKATCALSNGKIVNLYFDWSIPIKALKAKSE